MRAFIRPVLTGVVALIGFASGGASATTGLGQAWPDASDVSASPRFHVYVFEKQGLRFVQVNDANGTVRGAIAVAGDEVIGLPVGVDADHWSTAAGTLSAAGETVYHDASVTIAIAPQEDGSARLLAIQTDCKNPVECSVPGP